jgi:cell division protein FtsB
MFKKNVSSKIAIAGLIFLLIFLGNLKFKQWLSSREIQINITNLKQQVSEREQKNNELAQSLDYLNSNDFKEKVAREQLGFKKSGEIVYGFSEPSQNQSIAITETQEKTSNVQKWWNYFFSE